MTFFFSSEGYCPICRKNTTFEARSEWLRDNLICVTCPNGSIPRERALMLVLDRLFSDWRKYAIHESSPVHRGASYKLRDQCQRYIASQFFTDRPLGVEVLGFRNENLEQTTFEDEQFDLIITQDVLEHVNFPDRVFRECARTLKKGGAHIFTVPTLPDTIGIFRRAQFSENRIEHYAEPIYHGNPIDPNGSLVTFDYGYKLPEYIKDWSGLDVEVTRFHDSYHGLLGEFMEVYVAWKR